MEQSSYPDRVAETLAADLLRQLLAAEADGRAGVALDELVSQLHVPRRDNSA